MNHGPPSDAVTYPERTLQLAMAMTSGRQYPTRMREFLRRPKHVQVRSHRRRTR